jgi:hypothetical protein
LFLLAAKSLVEFSASGFLVTTARYMADTGSEGLGRALPLEPISQVVSGKIPSRFELEKWPG